MKDAILFPPDRNPGRFESPPCPADEPIRVAVIGTGGCAESHHLALAHLEREGFCTVVGTCDPNADRLPRPSCVKEGLMIHRDYRDLLDAIAGRADYVVVPTPIHWHGAMHRDVLAAGFACYLEKPPTLDRAEFAEMLAVERSAPKASFIGFSHLFRPEYANLKERLLRGDFGRIAEVKVTGFSPRLAAYFVRNSWAGKLLWDDRLLLDSCLGNGMAHHAHTALFFSGRDGVWSWDYPVSLRARLYRANRIEGPDTVFLEADLASGTRLKIAMSNACRERRREEWIECERARIRISYDGDTSISVDWRDGRRERFPLAPRNAYVENHRWYLEYLRGLRPRPCTLISDCRGIVDLNSLAYLSSEEIFSVPSTALETYRQGDCDGVRIPGLEQAARKYLDGGDLAGLHFGGRILPVPRRVAGQDLDGIHGLIRTIAGGIPWAQSSATEPAGAKS